MAGESARPSTDPVSSGLARDEAVMRRLAGGEVAALDEILREHWLAIVAYATSFVRVRELGEDIAQETMLRLWRQRQVWQPTSPLRPYLFRIARNLALNEKERSRVRARSRQALALGWARPATPLEELQQKELRLAIEAAVDQLPERRREVFLLGRLHGLSYEEIGQVMGTTRQTVANQMSAALATLRELLAAHR
jgi:RNA polymerase sigma-70 factor (ECF subfamily)